MGKSLSVGMQSETSFVKLRSGPFGLRVLLRRRKARALSGVCGRVAACILQNTDLIATVPERFANSCAQPFGLTSLPVPLPLPEIAINLFWHGKYNRDPANKWFRQLMFDLFSD